MNDSNIKIRLMKADDFNAVLAIAEKVRNVSRREYYDLKFEKLFKSVDYLPVSLVAENKDGAVVGYIVGELYQGEDGIFPEEANLDVISVDPVFRNRGIGEQLIKEFSDHLRKVGVKKLNTLVNSKDAKLMHFYSANKFNPSISIHMEKDL